jgi:hypothetical protein
LRAVHLVRRVVLRSRCKYGIMIGEMEGIVPAIDPNRRFEHGGLDKVLARVCGAIVATSAAEWTI